MPPTKDADISKKPSGKSFPIVGIGASAGGIEALEKLFRAMPTQAAEMAFVVVVHLDPKSHSILPTLLARWTPLTVKAIEEGENVQTHHIYVIPPDALATIKGGRLHLRKPSQPQPERAPIDIFFSSLAEDHGDNAIGIVLSGAGTDGALGIKAIKEHGGFTIAQGSNESEPGFKDMPQSAIATGLVDLVLPVEHIGEWLSRLTQMPAPAVQEKVDELQAIYSVLRDRLGHDFSQYRTRTFLRRVARRMQVLQVSSLADYVELLRGNPEEPGRLFRDLLIGVTEFFRNPNAFAVLEQLVIPKIFENKGPGDTVRVWVAGCASGEEAYSIAILLREFTEEHFKNAAPPKVTLFASDIDLDALKIARAGRYSFSVLKAVSRERLSRFFAPEGGAYRVIHPLRDMCVFTDHDLIRDPPFSRLDLLSCRNVLIYMKTELQQRLFPVFHYALRPGGFLFLGASESVTRHSELFVATDREHRIFHRRDLIVPIHAALPQFTRPNGGRAPRAGAPAERPAAASALKTASNLVSERYIPPHVIVNERWEVVHSSAGIGKFLQVPVGPPIRDLFAWARSDLRFYLREALHKAIETNRTVTRERISVDVDGVVQNIKLVVEPIHEGAETVFAIVFIDLGQTHSREQERQTPTSRGEAGAQVSQLEIELQETRERLQATIEELETANEELKSSNEELLSVNEELQSTNEEMETSKEEIQSVNEELQTVNQTLNQKVEELDHANGDLQNLLDSTQVAVIFLDDKLVVRTFTPSIREIFNLLPADRGRPLTDIVSSLDDNSLELLIDECVRKGRPIEHKMTAGNHTKHYLVRVVPYRTAEVVSGGVIVVFLDVTENVVTDEHRKTIGRELSELLKSTMDAFVAAAKQPTACAATVPALVQLFVSRLAALSFTHDLLSQSEWASVALDRLIDAELADQIGADRERIRIDGPAFPLTAHSALVLGVVLHELARDAVTYGALSIPGGRVEVRWNLRGPTDAAQVELLWAEAQGPQLGTDPGRTFGFEMIRSTIAAELMGTADVQFGKTGMRCAVAIPANQSSITALAPPPPMKALHLAPST